MAPKNKDERDGKSPLVVDIKKSGDIQIMKYHHISEFLKERLSRKNIIYPTEFIQFTETKEKLPEYPC